MRWYVVTNFREGDLAHLSPEKKTQVYVLGQAGKHFRGAVDSVGYGVFPDDGGGNAEGLPHVTSLAQLGARGPALFGSVRESRLGRVPHWRFGCGNPDTKRLMTCRFAATGNHELSNRRSQGQQQCSA